MSTPKTIISATIVLYNEDTKTLQNTIDSFLAVPLPKKLFLIDNSPNNKLSTIVKHSDVEYVFIGQNIGFGAGNNKVLTKIKDLSKYHLILNPDVIFNKNIIETLITELKKHKDVSMIAPQVLYTNGKHQHTVRKYPSFFDLIIRKLKILKKRIHIQEYRNNDLSKPFFPDCIHGCFQLYKTPDFVALNGFDERYFLYMEDIDICKKIDTTGKKKLYYPNVSIMHVLKQGSSKKFKLFCYHLSSAVKYFLKW